MRSGDRTDVSWPSPIPPSSVLPLVEAIDAETDVILAESTSHPSVASTFKATPVAGRCDH